MIKNKATSKNGIEKLFNFYEENGTKGHNPMYIKSWVKSKRCESKNKYQRLIEILRDIHFLKVIYKKIKLDPKNLSFEKNLKTNNYDQNNEWFKKTSELLKTGAYTLKPARCIMIKKAKKLRKKEPWIVINLRDRIILEGIKTILSYIYELEYSNFSYQFYTKPNYQNTLQQVKRWNEVDWFVKFTLEKGFNSKNQRHLIDTLKEKIDDQFFFNLLNNMFKGKILNVQLGSPDRKNDILQKSILPSLLCNIYLYTLDQFTEKQIQKIKIIKKQKVKYIRYLDDFLFGIVGSKSLAIEFFNKIFFFLESDLQLKISKKKSGLCSSTNRMVKFLGMNLIRIPTITSPFVIQGGKELEYKAKTLKKIRNCIKTNEEKVLKLYKKELKKTLVIAMHEQKKKGALLKKTEVIRNLVTILANTRSNITRKIFRDFTLKTLINIDPKVFSLTLIKAYHRFLSELNNESEEILDKRHAMKSTGINTNTKKKVVITKINLPIQIYAPIKEIQNKLRKKGMICKQGKPKVVYSLQNQTDKKIMKWFVKLGQGQLNYYHGANNFSRVKRIVNYFMRWSAFHTLAKKYKCSLKQIITKVGFYFKKLVVKPKNKLNSLTKIKTFNFSKSYLSKEKIVKTEKSLQLRKRETKK